MYMDYITKLDQDSGTNSEQQQQNADPRPYSQQSSNISSYGVQPTNQKQTSYEDKNDENYDDSETQSTVSSNQKFLQ